MTAANYSVLQKTKENYSISFLLISIYFNISFLFYCFPIDSGELYTWVQMKMAALVLGILSYLDLLLGHFHFWQLHSFLYLHDRVLILQIMFI